MKNFLEASIIPIIVIAMLLGGVYFIFGQYREQHPSTTEVSLIGYVSVSKSEGKYYLYYESEIDKVEAGCEIPGDIDLNSVKTIIDASVDKRFDKLKVDQECISKLASEYKSRAKYVESRTILNCGVYGDYKTALKVYDRNLYVDGLISRYEIIDVDDFFYSYRGGDKYINLVER
jgi:hypothetical protein